MVPFSVLLTAVPVGVDLLPLGAVSLAGVDVLRLGTACLAGEDLLVLGAACLAGGEFAFSVCFLGFFLFFFFGSLLASPDPARLEAERHRKGLESNRTAIS